MKVVAFNGSARKDGNTAILVRRVFSELEKEGIETELVQLAGQPIHGCAACGQCFKNFDSINHFFLIGQMIIPGSSYWNIGIGRAKGEVEQDEEGLRTMQALGQNMAWLLKKINT